MSELMNNSSSRKNLRRQLLTTVSALALGGFVVTAPGARASADDADRPTIWIDLGGQLERTDRGSDLPAVPFDSYVQAPLRSPNMIDKAPPYSFGGEAGISFQPHDSDWIFLASVRYGRSSGKKHAHDQTAQVLHKYVYPILHYTHYTPQAVKVIDTNAMHRESHSIIDFQVGKDLGLGLFGGQSSSVLAAGVRIAQFASRASTVVNAKPDLEFYNYFPSYLPPSRFYIPIAHYHVFGFAAQTRDQFRGIGPSISWNASQMLAGNKDSSEITLDWGLNAAVLFGRQKRTIHHETKAGYVHDKLYPNKYQQLYHSNADHSRDRAVAVPDIGGFAGISFRYADAKISFGYRGDFFLGALDTGNDTAKRTNVGFHGPYASISVGIGD
jgi:hypothetical protein